MLQHQSSLSALISAKTIPLSEKLAWSLDEAALATGLCIRTIQMAIDRGELRASRIGRRVLLLPDRVRAWLISCESNAADA